MEDSVGQTIEKIKLHEQGNEIRLREKRELSNTILMLNRSIRDSWTHLDKMTKECESLILATDSLKHQLILEKIRLFAVRAEVIRCHKELQQLREASNLGVTAVWNKRTILLQTIQDVVDKCDIRALLIKPTNNEIIPYTKLAKIKKNFQNDDTNLKQVIEKRDKAIAVRNYLISEPEIGEEFIRIKNALQYSMEIAANNSQTKST